MKPNGDVLQNTINDEERKATCVQKTPFGDGKRASQVDCSFMLRFFSPISNAVLTHFSQARMSPNRRIISHSPDTVLEIRPRWVKKAQSPNILYCISDDFRRPGRGSLGRLSQAQPFQRPVRSGNRRNKNRFSSPPFLTWLS